MTIARYFQRGSRFALAAVAVAVLVALPLFAASPASAGSHVGALPTCAPGVDFLGYSEALNKTAFGGFNVTELSGITYDPRKQVYYAVSDRSGATQSHVFTVKVPVSGGALGTPSINDVLVLNDPSGTPYNGFNFDGEGIVMTRHGDFIVSSEGGSGVTVPAQQPEIRRFSKAGAHLAELAVPARFLIGRNNLSFESLALSPNGRSLFTANEGPLAEDGRTVDLRSRIRIIRYEAHGKSDFAPVAEYFYQTEPGRTVSDVGVVELIALSGEDLLVMERGFVAGQGNTVRIFRVSIEDAEDVSDEPALSAAGLTPLAKELVVDVRNCPPSGATSPEVQPNPLLDNFEAMALGPKLPGGRRALVLLSDDNESATQVTRLIALAVRTRDIVGDDADEDGGSADDDEDSDSGSDD